MNPAIPQSGNSGTDTDIFVVNPDTQEILDRTGVSDIPETHPSFSPDGLLYVYSATPGHEDWELVVHWWYTKEKLMTITHDDTYDGSPSWGWNW